MAEPYFIHAKEMAKILDVSEAKAYELCRKANSKLEKEGYIVVAGRMPRAYFERFLYGFQDDKDRK